ncbi:hypothetical protein C3B44_08455 [Corynebacterium yudongzhengii]|uniref:DoxX family membrane protein n=1 Tax=Corynebacterium yudongzhengii TaxID=2080740 RepID=A0A2U1T452_9CORY|nr:hypothetical protein [Corynebacterium yudongzhengii]AWB82378.1 hypothetical protein C3B44_08455 [Corynebacterium yudongzhengii]PWC00762.1 hypothetical protein DF222_11040 [Corynebacterium yudongzhengii]
MNFLTSAALRVIPGAFILNSGIGKIGMPADASKGIQDFAATGVPAVKEIPSDQFGTVLGWSETALGGALLAPFVPNAAAGAGLTAFSVGLLSLYFADDDNTEEDGIRPSEQGLSLAKDSFLLAIGLGLLVGGLFGGKKKNKKAKKAKKAKKNS